MTKAIIEVGNLGKRYQLGESLSHDLLRERISHGIRNLVRSVRTPAKVREDFWALRDINFSVSEGEVLGVIGRNGAGKSTLLKILSRITEPSEGEVRMRGRVASLLEVGTGFHKELTGRENVYLNGAILGMSRAEINARFNDIVEFAGVEQFIDTPVKRYSSGMTVRLAFAVAANLEPEILLIDEVLAVGDADFQKRCIGKMSEVARGGRTILFVSHNMAAVENLCTRAVLLQQGRLVMTGDVDTVIAAYSEAAESFNQTDVTNHPSRVTGVEGAFRHFEVRDEAGNPTWQLPLGGSATFIVELEAADAHRDIIVAMHFYNQMGQRVTTAQTQYQSRIRLVGGRRERITFSLPALDLIPGQYTILLAAAAGTTVLDRIDPVANIEVLPRDVFETGALPPARDGVFILRGTWARS